MAVIKTQTFAEKVVQLLNRAKREGMTYNTQMGGIARLCADFNIHPQVACDHMHLASMSVLRRKPSALEIENWIKWAYTKKQQDVGTLAGRKTRSQARRNPDIIAEWAKKGSLQDLINRSEPIPQKASEILESLYQDDDLLHISPNKFRKDVKSRDEWLQDDLTRMQFFCPCIFKDVETGRLAENVAQRKYIVFETDDLPKDWDAQSGLINRLSQEQKLVLVVNSSNKSLHAVFEAPDTEEATNKFTDLAITLGADRAVLRPSQMARFPWGTNEKTGKIQEVLFYGR